MSQHKKDQNLDQQVIDSFGHEWAAFDYAESETDEALDSQFLAYCTPIDLSQFNAKSSVAADFGAGSGRWASRLLPYFPLVYALEPSEGGAAFLALNVFLSLIAVIVVLPLARKLIPVRS